MPEVTPVSLQFLSEEAGDGIDNPDETTQVSRDDPLPVDFIDTLSDEEGPPIHTETVLLSMALGATAYTAGDAVGALFMLPRMARRPGWGGEVISVVLLEDTAQAITGTLYLYRSKVTGLADNSAFTGGTDAENRLCVGFVPVVSVPGTAPTSNKIMEARGVGLGYQCAPDSTALYAQFQTDGTPTYAIDAISLLVTVRRD